MKKQKTLSFSSKLSVNTLNMKETLQIVGGTNAIINNHTEEWVCPV